MNIKTAAPLLADVFIDVEIEQSAYADYEKLINKHAARLGLFHKYIGRLHDSGVIETNLSEQNFSILLNDFSTHVFADAVVERNNLTINHDSLLFPIRLDFSIKTITYNTVDEEGDICQIPPLTTHEYLYEQLVAVNDDNLDFALVLWKDGKDKPGSHILVLMAATSVTTTELQDAQWNKIFGSEYDNIYHYFKTELVAGRYLSDIGSCRALIEEFEQKT